MNAPPSLSGVRHEYADAAGLRMHFALAGPTDAPPVLLVHGWPQNWWTWRHVIPEIAGRFRVIVPDLRGHGWSDAPRAGYDKEQLASDLLALLDSLGIERATWIGHDWGGWTGFLAALRAPERIARLLALCIPHPWTAPHVSDLALLGYQGPISLPFLGAHLVDPMVRAVLQSGRHGERLPADDVAVFAQRIPRHVTVAMYRTFLTREVLPIARGRYSQAILEVPSTVLVGDRDLVTRGTAPGPVDGQPRLSVDVLAGVGHWVPEQRSERVVEWLEGERSEHERTPAG